MTIENPEAQPSSESASLRSLAPRWLGPALSMAAVAAVVASAAYVFVHDRKAGELGDAQVRSRLANEVILRGVTHQKSGHLEVAETLYNEALRLEPRAAYAFFDLGTVAIERNQWEVAQWYFEQALAIDPSLSAAKHDLEIVAARSASEPDPAHPDLMAAALQALDQDELPERAVSLLRRVLELRPDHYGANFQIARAMDRCGRRAEARPLWNHALELARAVGDAGTIALIGKRLDEKD